MLLSFWIARVLRLPSRLSRRQRRAARRATHRTFRPHLESLEDRTLLSAIVVTTTADDPTTPISGQTTLRDAVNQANANPGSTIEFNLSTSDAGYQNGVWTITLGGSALPSITQNVTIDGLGANELVVSGNNQSRVFTIGGGAQVNISGLTIEDGKVGSGSGAGINSNGATVTVNNCTIKDNTVTSGAGGGVMNSGFGTLTLSNSTLTGNSAEFGGGIWSNGTLTVNNSVLTDNSAQAGSGAIASGGTTTVNGSTLLGNSAEYGGGIGNSGTLTVFQSTFIDNSASVNGGGIDTDGSATVNDSTFSGNSASSYGGGIANDGNSPGTLTVTNSTLASNSANQGGGIANVFTAPTATLDNTIVAKSTSGGDLYFQTGGNGFTGSYNLIGDGSDLSSFTHSLQGDPHLASLGYYGGPTQTMTLLPGSAALGVGDPTQSGKTDERGFVRGSSVDIGAFQTQAAPLQVNTSDDTATGAESTGNLSLRDAINLVNVLSPAGGAKTITFAIPTSDAGYNASAGTWTIAPVAALPTIAAPAILDGTSQPGYTSKPVIVLSGLNAGSTSYGLLITGGNSTVKGLVINQFGGDGIDLLTNGGDVIQGDDIGTDATGTIAEGNGGNGVYVSSAGNTIGGTAAGAGNVISGNRGDGIDLVGAAQASGEVSYYPLEGNTTDATGKNPVSATNAISFVPDSFGQGVTFGSNSYIEIPDSSSLDSQQLTISAWADPQGIGPNNDAYGSVLVGKDIPFANGGQTADTFGTYWTGDDHFDLIVGSVNNLLKSTDTFLPGQFYFVTATYDGSTARLYVNGVLEGQLTIGTPLTYYSSTPWTIGSSDSETRNAGYSRTWNGIINDVGFYNQALNSTQIQGLYTSGVQGSNVVEGNFIGTNAAGTAALGNGGNGVFVSSAENTIGGSAQGASNVLSGNTGDGVEITGTSAAGNAVEGNFIGTNAAGTAAIPNQFVNGGVLITQGASNNIIGGTGAADRNIISGNASVGVYLKGASSNVVAGNYIGTDVSGTTALGNGDVGIQIDGGGTGNVVGGTTAGSGNVISADVYGVFLRGTGTTANALEGNFIGTNATGTAALGNAGYGVSIDTGASGNIIGGTTAAARNVISGNNWSGVYIIDSGTTGNVVEGNYIGTNAAGNAALKNGNLGVWLDLGASNNTIGGTAAGAGNVISGNNYQGVGIFGAGTNSNVIADNYIGTDASGNVGVGNGNNGIWINNGPQSNLIENNVLSANTYNGIALGDDTNAGTANNIIAGNLIGTNASGTTALGNAEFGIYLYGGKTNTIGGTTAAARNVISGNTWSGIYISGANTASNVVEGNYIGTDVTGTLALPNTASAGTAYQFSGGQVSANIPQLNTSTGAATTVSFWMNWNGTTNVMPIAFNSAYELQFYNGYFGFNTANNDLLAVSSAGLANQWHLVTAVFFNGNPSQNQLWIDGVQQTLTQVVGTPLARNVSTGVTLGNGLSGAYPYHGGLADVAFFNVQLTAAQIQAQYSAAAAGTFNETILGPGPVAYYRLNETSGTTAVDSSGYGNNGTLSATGITLGAAGPPVASFAGNAQNGVVIASGANGNIVGGTTAAARNIISGNAENGVVITDNGTTGNVVEGNYIGTDVSGSHALLNVSLGTTSFFNNDGVLIENGAQNNTIGGQTAASGNVISGNLERGVEIDATNNIVQSNYIGVNAAGTGAIGNGGDGMSMFFANNNQIGGAGAGNVISGNGRVGIYSYDSNNNTMAGNFIGTNAAGAAAFGNGIWGIILGGGSSNNQIGGTTAAALNVISGNSDGGVLITGSGAAGNFVEGNYIGTNAAGSAALGNVGYGVSLQSSSVNSILNNTISGNSSDGINISGNGALPGTVSWWQAAGNTNDSVGTNNGTLVNGATFGPGVAGGQAFSFDGVNAYVQAPTNGLPTGNSDRTLELWFNLRSYPTSEAFLAGYGNFGSFTQTYQLGVNSNGQVFWSQWGYGPSGGPVLQLGQWYHVAVTTAGNITTLYLNGVALTSGNVPINTPSGTQFYMGRIPGTLGNTRVLNGLVDEVGVYNRALSAAEIQTIYSLGGSAKGGATIQGNYIGINAAGTAALGNAGNGITLSNSSGNTIGGTTAAARNVISGNLAAGLEIYEGSFNTVEGNYVGTNAAGTAAIGNTYRGVFVYFSSADVIGGTAAGAGNVLAGSLNWEGLGIFNSSSVTVQGNAIGTNASGTSALGNSGSGVEIEDDSSITIGGSLAAARNIISGNLGIGVRIYSSTSVTVQGDYIGTDISGAVALGNGTGVYMDGGSSGDVVEGDVISGNRSDGVDIITGGNIVEGDYIGTNAAGTAALGNSGDGVFVSSAGNTIGGATAAALNVISGNLANGVEINGSSATGNVVQGNYIGTNAAGTAALGNSRYGIYQISASVNSILGNTISANGSDGININGNSGLVSYYAADGNANDSVGGNNGTFTNPSYATGISGQAFNFNGVNNYVQVPDSLDLSPEATTGEITVSAWVKTSAYPPNTGQGRTAIVAKGNNPSEWEYALNLGANGAVQFSVWNPNGTGYAEPIGGTLPLDGKWHLITGTMEEGKFVRIYLDGVLVAQQTTSFYGSPAFGASPLFIGRRGDGQFFNGQVDGVALYNRALTSAEVSGLYNAAGASPVVSAGGNTGGDTIQGNLIGTNAAGTAALANVGSGISIVNSAGNTIGGTTSAAGNVLSGNVNNGVDITGSSATGNIVEGNYIGTNAAGTAALSNGGGIVSTTVQASGGNGISINNAANNIIGGTTTAARNVISGNVDNGVAISGSGATGNVVEGNYIGTNAAGTASLAVGSRTPWSAGVMIEYGASNNIIGTNGDGVNDAAEANLISGNIGDGVGIFDNGTNNNIVAGNLIGTDYTGKLAVANQWDGILITFAAQYNRIGANGADVDAAAERNVISANVGIGVEIGRAGANHNWVAGNYIGTDITGTAALGNRSAGVWIWSGAQSNLIGTNSDGVGDAAERNVVSGNAGANVQIQDAGTTSNVVAGNYIGTNAAGAAALGSGWIGVYIFNGASGNRIGGDGSSAAADAADRNIIGGNGGDEVQISGAGTNNNIVASNYISTDVTGTIALPTPANDSGVSIFGGASNNRIGTSGAEADNAGERNVISGNTNGFGVYISDPTTTGNLVAGNYIGVNAGDAAALGNSVGVFVQGPNNIIGGATAAMSNVISGNSNYGIEIATTSATSSVVEGTGEVVEGNYIGTNAAGTAALANGTGILIQGASNTIGGATAAARNLISGNYGDGVDITGTSATGNVVEGNYIGTNAAGTAALGNSGDGVFVSSAGNTIGSTTAAARNVISGNSRDGVDINGSSATGNFVTGNYIGTDAGGTVAINNGGDGVQIVNTAGNTIGGTAAGAGNIISGNAGDGINLLGNTFADNFATLHDYSGGNVSGTGWDGVLNPGNLVTGNAGITAPATLTWAPAANVGWENSQDNGPVLYKTVTGDFDVSVHVSSITTSAYSDGGLMVRVPGPVGSTENYVALRDFGAFGFNATRNTVNSSTTNNNYPVYQPYLRITRTGSTFQLYTKANASDPWTLRDTVVRSDIAAGSAMQVGLWFGTFNTGNLGQIQFDHFALSASSLGGPTTGNVIQGNSIGTNASGNASLANGGNGITISNLANNIIGGTTAAARNVISGNLNNGVDITGSSATGNVVAGNYIGTNAAGASALGNGSVGVLIINGASGNRIGGDGSSAAADAADRNIIGGNSWDAVQINGAGTNNNIVASNYINTDVTGTIALPTAASANDSGVAIFGGASNNRIGTSGAEADNAGERNVISGNTNGFGVYISDPTTTGNLVAGNYIGVNAADTAALGNLDGIFVQGPNNIIGGSTAAMSNVISGNEDAGIVIATTSATSSVVEGTGEVVEGNYIGTNAAGTAALANNTGILIQGAFNTIGGTTAGDGNIISGNSGFGVYITGTSATGNVVEGNYIGTNAAGTAALGNSDYGVYVTGSYNTIGGTTAAARNIISGNANGVQISFTSATGNVVEGNYIGTDVTGTQALGNSDDGVAITGGASNNRIGGTTAAARNVISGNALAGVVLTDIGTTGNTVEGNYIGTNAAGNAALGNSTDGIQIANGASSNIIGGLSAGQANVIAYNTGDGVNVSGSQSVGNPIRGNSIYANGGLGINLNGTGNNNQASPVMIAAALDSATPLNNLPAGSTEFKATFTGKANTTYQLDIYDNHATFSPNGGQGQTYLGTVTIITDSNGNPVTDGNGNLLLDASGNPVPAASASSTFFFVFNATPPEGDVLSVTANDPAGNTSQFSDDITTILRPEISVAGLGLGVRGQMIPYTITPSISASDLAAGLNYTINWGDGAYPNGVNYQPVSGQYIDRNPDVQTINSTLASVVQNHVFTTDQPPNTPYTITTTVQDQYGFTGTTVTNTTQVNLFALENNNSEMDVGALYGGSTFTLTGVLSHSDPSTDSFNLDLDAGTANAVTINYTDSEFTPAVLASLTQFVLWGQLATGTQSNSFDASQYTGVVDSHNGPGNNTQVGSTTGTNVFSYDAHAQDHLTIVAPSTANNTLSFTGADQGVTFDLSQLSGQTQTITATGDTLVVTGSSGGHKISTGGQTNATGSINTYYTSNFNDTLYTPGANNLQVFGGAGNDSYVFNPIPGSDPVYSVSNSTFTGGTGNSTFTIAGGSGNNTFTINNSSFTGSNNSTFTVNGGSGNTTFALANSTSSNSSFTIAAAGSNSSFTIGGGTSNGSFTLVNTTGNGTFTLGNVAAANGSFTISGSGTNGTFTMGNVLASNGTFTVGGGTGNSSFTLGNVVTNSTFSLATGTGDSSFTLGNVVNNSSFTLNTGVGNGTFTLGGVTNNGSFTLNTGGGNGSFTLGNVVSNGSFTLGTATSNGSFTVGAGSVTTNGSFTLGTGSGNGTFTLGAVSTNGSFTVGTGIGNGSFTMGSLTTNGTFTAGAQTGNASFTIGNINVVNNSSFTMGTGSGNGSFTVSAGNVNSNGSFALGTGNGNGSFTVSSISGNGSFTMGTGTGNGTFTVGTTAANGTFTAGSVTTNGSFTMGTGSGNGSFTMGTLTTNGTFTAGTQTGNASFTIGGINVVNNSSFTMGTGSGNGSFTVAAGNVNSNGSFTLGTGTSSNSSFTMGTVTANGTFTAETGTGNGSFTVSSLGGNGSFTLGTGTGNGTFTVGTTAANGTFTAGSVTTNGSFTMGTSSGNGSFTMGTLTTNGTFTAGTGSGNGSFTIGDINVGNNSSFTMGTGSGNGSFTVAAGNVNSNGSFTLGTGSGNGSFTVSSVSGNGSFTMGTGTGNGTFTVGTTAANGTFTAGSVTTNGSFTLSTGTGNGSFTMGGVSTNGTFIAATTSANGTFKLGDVSSNGTFVVGAGTVANGSFTLGTGGSNGSFTMGNLTTNGTFTAGTGSGNASFTIGNVNVVNNSSFTMGTGSGNGSFTVGAGNVNSNGSFTLETGSGNGSFTLGTVAVTNGSFTLGTGSGNGSFTVSSVGGNGSFTMGTGTGNGTFTVGTTAANGTFTAGAVTTNGSFTMGTSSGNGSFTMGTLTTNGTFTAGTQTGNGSFTMGNIVNNGSFTLGTGSGNGSFTVGAGNVTTNGSFTLGTGTSSANSSFTMGTVTANGTFTAVTGTGNGSFTMGNVSSNGSFTVGTSAGNGSFTMGNVSTNGTFTAGTGTGNGTFTLASATTTGNNGTFVLTTGLANGTFTITNGVTSQGSNDTFALNNSDASSGGTTLTVNSSFYGSSSGNNFFLQDTGTGASNDSIILNGNIYAGAGNDRLSISAQNAGNDAITINGGFYGDATGQNGAGNDYVLINNSGSGNNSFSITGGVQDGGTSNSALVMSNTGQGNDTYYIGKNAAGSAFTGGSGIGYFLINNTGNGNSQYTVDGSVSLGNSDFTFVTLSQEGNGNNTIAVNGSMTVGNGNDFFSFGEAGTGTDSISVAGPFTFGKGDDSFELSGGGEGNKTFNFLGGVHGTGFDTYTINDHGYNDNLGALVGGSASFTMNGNFGGGAGNNTFIVTSGLGGSDGTDTFTFNGNLQGGGGFNTFSLTNAGAAYNPFTFNGSLVGGANDAGDDFQLAGDYLGTTGLVSGSGAGADNFQFAGALQGNFAITAPNQTNRTDTLDFSTLSQGVNVDISSTSAQQVASGLTLQLSDANGISNVIGSSHNNVIHGNARSNMLAGYDALDSNYTSTAPGVGANGKVQVVLLDFDTGPNNFTALVNGQQVPVFDFNTYYAQYGATPIRLYTQAERQAVLQGLQADYAPFLAVFNGTTLVQGGVYFTTSATDAQNVANSYANGKYITEYFDQTPGANTNPDNGIPPAPSVNQNLQPGGVSNDLDFRDADMTGTASIQVNGIVGEPLNPPATEQNWVNVSVYLAAHELGHLVGLHHDDAFGPIGQGIIPLPNGMNYDPPYAGPYDAAETFDHVITSGDATGTDWWNGTRGLFFGEREDITLAFAFAAPTTPGPQGSLLVQQTTSAINSSTWSAPPSTQPTTLAMPPNTQSITLAPLAVPNTELYGQDTGKTFEVQAVDVLGNVGLDSTGHSQQDYYSFTGNAGDVINANVMSYGITRYVNQGAAGYFDSVAYLYYQDPTTGQLTQVAFNDDTYSASASGDATLKDIVLPKTGTYVLEVKPFAYASSDSHPDPSQFTGDDKIHLEDAINNTYTGNYELFVYRFKAGMTTSGNNTFTSGTGNATMIGGQGVNTFYLNSSANDTVVGVGSNNTVIGSSATNNWTLTGYDAGTVNNASFTNVQNLAGGSGNNNFTLQPGSGLAGSITGGAGAANTIIVSRDANFTLTNTSLTTSAGDSYSIADIQQADLTMTGSDAHTFDVSGWSGGGQLTGNGYATLQATKNANFTLTSSSLASSDGMNVGYSGLTALNITGSGAANTVNVQSTNAAVTTTVTDGGTINVGSLAPTAGGILDNIAGALIVNGGGTATLVADDTGSSKSKTGTLTSMTLTGLGMGASGISYSGLKTLNISLGSGGNTFNINSVNPSTATTVDGGSGINTANVSSAAASASNLTLHHFRPNSLVSPLGSTQSSDTFTVPVTFSDGSGVASVDLYYSTNHGTTWTLYQNLAANGATSGALNFSFTGQDRNTYDFYSIAHSISGAVQSTPTNRIEASTIVPDLNPPVTHALAASPGYSWVPFSASEFNGLTASSYNSSNGAFTITWAGADPDQNSGTPLGSIATVAVFVSVDGGAYQQIGAALNGGSPNANGVYSGSLTYNALADGQPHSYSFYTLGTDDLGKTQATPTTADVTFSNISYTAPLAVSAFNVIHSETQNTPLTERSFIRYLEVDFNQSPNVNAPNFLSNLSTNVELLYFGTNGTVQGSVSLSNVAATLSGNSLFLDFGANGLTSALTLTGGQTAPSNPTSNTFGDGWYALGISSKATGTGSPIWVPFFRLLGSATGDTTVSGTATGADYLLVSGAVNKTPINYNADLNGDGSVNSNDVKLVKLSNAHTAGNVPTSFPQFQLFAGPASSGQAAPISEATVTALIPEAIDAWKAAGLDTADVQLMTQARVQVADLNGNILGLEQGGEIWISDTAAGYGWYVAGKSAADEVDLLTVLEHELGHIVGLADNGLSGDLMNTTLGLGVRRTPTAADVSQLAGNTNPAGSQPISPTGSAGPGLTAAAWSFPLLGASIGTAGNTGNDVGLLEVDDALFSLLGQLASVGSVWESDLLLLIGAVEDALNMPRTIS